MVAAVFMNGGAGPWTAAACGAVAREARSAAWRRWTGGTRGDQANTFSDPRARGPRRTQEDLGGPGRTLETRRTPTFPVLWKIHKEERKRRTRKAGNQLLGPKTETKGSKSTRVSMYL